MNMKPASKVFVIAMVICGVLSLLSWAQPLNVSEMEPKLKYGTASEIEREVKMNFPEILSSRVSPYEYLRSKGFNVTGTDILPFVLQNRISAQRKRRSYQEPSASGLAFCPVTWKVNFKEGRTPAEIMFASCDGQGSLCKSSDGTIRCEEVKVTKLVYKFLGIDWRGRSVYIQKKISIPVACTCAA